MAQNNMLNSPQPFAIAKGGTGVSSVTTTPTATSWAGWDANLNLSANNIIYGYATTATAAGTTTLLVGSPRQQYFTGATTQTVLLPVTSTLTLGQSFFIVNNSSGVVTVQSSGANSIQAMASGTTLLVTCILTSGTTAASWNPSYSSMTGGADFPVNTNITSMTGLTGYLATPLGIKDTLGNVIVSYSTIALPTGHWDIFPGLTGAGLQVVSTSATASGSILGKGAGGVLLGSIGATTIPIELQVGSYKLTHYVPSLTATRVLTYPDADVNFSAGTLAAYTAWTTYTPTITLVGGAGNTVPTFTTTSTGRWTKIGTTVTVQINFANAAGGTAGAGTGAFTVALPVTPGASATSQLLPIARYIVGANTYVGLCALIASTATVTCYYILANVLTALTGNNFSNATRAFQVTLTYEV